MSELQHIVDNSEQLIEMAKRLQSSKQRYQKTLEKEQAARDEIKELQQEAHKITTSMANDKDMSELRSLDEVTRDMRKANNRVDRAIDKSHGDHDAIEEIAQEIMALVSGSNEVEAQGEVEALDEVEGGDEMLDEPGIEFATYDEDSQDMPKAAMAG